MDSSRVPLKGGGDHAVRGRQHGTPSAAPLSRRKLGLGLLLGFSGVAAIPSEARDLTPYERGFRLEYGLTADGRMRSCPSDSNPNCVSSASLNECYSPAWESSQEDVRQAIKEFEVALMEVNPGAEPIDARSTTSSEYRRYRISNTLFHHDDVEVLIATREDGEPPLVTYRSMAGTVKYIWPITQPITDFGAQRTRMKAVRERLGWRIPGCDLLECYLE